MITHSLPILAIILTLPLPYIGLTFSLYCPLYCPSLLNDMKRHYTDPLQHGYPDKSNPLLPELTSLLESCGMEDPLQKIYITSHNLESLPILMLLFTITYLPKLEYDHDFGSLVRRKLKFPVDGYPMIIGIACIMKQVGVIGESFYLHNTQLFLLKSVCAS